MAKKLPFISLAINFSLSYIRVPPSVLVVLLSCCFQEDKYFNKERIFWHNICLGSIQVLLLSNSFINTENP